MVSERRCDDSNGDGNLCSNPRCRKPLAVLEMDVVGSQKVFCSAKCEQEAKLIRENQMTDLLLRVKAAGEVS